MAEVGSKKMKEKIQGQDFHIQECGFTNTQEDGSTNRFKSRSYLYARYGQDKNVS